MITKFIDSLYPPAIVKVLCPVLKVLSTSCPLTSIINYRFVEKLSSIVNNPTVIDTSPLIMELPELCKLLDVASSLNELETIVPFIKYLITRIKELHQNDK